MELAEDVVKPLRAMGWEGNGVLYGVEHPTENQFDCLPRGIPFA
jgi:hypothetical protein